MGKGKIIAGTLAGLIMAGGIAGAGYFGYKTIKDRDNTIDEQKTTIVALEDENKISKEKIEQLTKDLSAKVSEIAEKDKQIAEKDNLIEENNHKIQTLNNQKTTLLASVAEIDNKLTSTTDAVDVDNLEARKTAILGQIDVLNTEIANLTNEKTKLEQDVDTLTTEKQNLQNQIDTLNTRLAEFDQYTLNIDQTIPVESIKIEDTKLGTSATMSDVNIKTLTLYSWQNATIKYASVDGATVKATLNGTSQDTDTITIVGSNNKGASISIGAITEAKSDVLNLRKKMFISQDNQWVVDFGTKQVALYGGLMTIDTSANKTVNIDGEDFNKYNLNTNLGGSTNYFVWVDNLDFPSKVYCGSSTSDDSDIPQDKSLFVQQTIKNPTVQPYYTDCKTQSFNFSDNTLTLNESGSAKLTGTFTQTDNILTVTWSDGSSAEITLIGTAVLIYNDSFFTLP